ncbi:MAG: response regulator receiver protein [Rhizorhabdus sp.]|nr:response regulator receiver protein [Rhizorhabdus sp.]
MMANNKDAVEGRPRILLVEDDVGVRRSIQLLLHAHGYEVRAYALGAALLADPTLGDAVALIADYRMADIDGVAILSVLRSRGWNAPAILITAHLSPQVSRFADEAGYARILEKPMRERELTDTLNRLLGNSPGRAGEVNV